MYSCENVLNGKITLENQTMMDIVDGNTYAAYGLW